MLRLILILAYAVHAIAEYGIEDTRFWHTRTGQLVWSGTNPDPPASSFYVMGGLSYPSRVSGATITTTSDTNAVVVDLSGISPTMDAAFSITNLIQDTYRVPPNEIATDGLTNVAWTGTGDAFVGGEGVANEWIHPLSLDTGNLVAKQVGNLYNRVPVPNVFDFTGRRNTGVSGGTLSWSIVQLHGYNPSNMYAFFSLNLCVRSDQCGGGSCVGLPMTIKSTFGNYFVSGADMLTQTVDPVLRTSGQFSVSQWYVNGYQSGSVNIHAQRWKYNIRGCMCPTGKHGLTCADVCPSRANGREGDICLNRGTCARGTTKTDDNMDTCVCTSGCECKDGYDGKYCEIAVQAPPQNLTQDIQNFDICCPYDSPDCSTMRRWTDTTIVARPLRPRVPRSLYSVCVTKQISAGGTIAACESESTKPIDYEKGKWDHADFDTHLTIDTGAPDPCGESDGVEFWPLGKAYNASQHYYLGHDTTVIDGNLTAVRVGRGLCAKDPRPDTSRAMCYCNAPERWSEDKKQLIHRARRGWWPGYNANNQPNDATNCGTRTCTEKVLPKWNTDTKQWSLYKAVTSRTDGFGHILQCNGWHAPELADGINDGDKLYRQQLGTICADTVYLEDRGVWNEGPGINEAVLANRPGDCRKCQQGMGAVAGLSEQKLANYHSRDVGQRANGLCMERTLHTHTGLVCGGFGVAVNHSDAVAMMSQGGVPADKYDVSMPVASCTCEEPYTTKWFFTPLASKNEPSDPADGKTLTPVDTGMCLRTCAGSYFVYNQTSGVNSTGGFTLFNLPTSCGGVEQGFCRPIADGFNSACMCNIGFMGHECKQRNDRAYDLGEDLDNTVDKLCGDYGDYRVKPALERNLNHSADVNYFYSVIAKMKPWELSRNETYTGYECACREGAPEGYDTNNTKGVCARSCNALVSDGKVCGGHGECVEMVGRAAKECLCDLGWTGDRCDKVFAPAGPDYRGNVTNATGTDWGSCGGPTRGLPIFTSSDRRDQMCACMPGHDLSPTTGACYKPCPATSGVVCSGQGTCKIQETSEGVATNYGDAYCDCSLGREGVACEIPASCSLVQGGYIACAGNGLIDAETLMCICNRGFVGACCELPLEGYNQTSVLDCGVGQPYVNNTLRGATLAGPLGAERWVPSDPDPCGVFSVAAYLSHSPAYQPRSYVNAFQLWVKGNNRTVVLSTGAVGTLAPYTNATQKVCVV